MDPRLLHDDALHAVCGVSVAALGLAEAGLQWRTRGTVGVRSDRGTYWILAATLGVAIVCLSRAHRWAPGLSISDGGLWPVLVGLVLFWLGVALRWWGVLSLGEFFQLTVVVRDDHRLVQSGPYHWLRHPGYAGLVLILVGAAFAYDNWLGVALTTIVALAGIQPRIRVEERELEARLGEPYRRYAARTRRLVPGVW